MIASGCHVKHAKKTFLIIRNDVKCQTCGLPRKRACSVEHAKPSNHAEGNGHDQGKEQSSTGCNACRRDDADIRLWVPTTFPPPTTRISMVDRGRGARRRFQPHPPARRCNDLHEANVPLETCRPLRPPTPIPAMAKAPIRGRLREVTNTRSKTGDAECLDPWHRFIVKGRTRQVLRYCLYTNYDCHSLKPANPLMV